MSWISDLIKEIPLSSVLKEKMATIEEKYKELETKCSDLETENGDLKKQLSDAKTKINALEQQIVNLTQIDDLDEIQKQVLRCLANFSDSLEVEFIAQETQIHKVRIENSLDKLKSSKYVVLERNHSGDLCYQLTPKGREYCIENNLL